MHKYFTKIQLPNSDEPEYLRFHKELIKVTASHYKISVLSDNSKPGLQGLEYDVEGNVTIAALGRVVSNIAARFNKHYSFTIIRKKPGLKYA